MKNVTLSMDDGLLEAGRECARRQGTTLNNLIRRLLEHEVAPAPKQGLRELFALMDKHPIRTQSRWKREGLYDL